MSFSKITLGWGYKFDKFALFDFVLPGDTSDSRNSGNSSQVCCMHFEDVHEEV